MNSLDNVSYNRFILQHLTESSVKTPSDIPRQAKMKAIAKVLGEKTDEYIQGKSRLTDKQIKSILTCSKKIQDKLEKRHASLEKKSLKKAESMEKHIGQIQHEIAKDPGKKAQGLTDYYQVMGCQAAYRIDLKQGDKVPGPYPDTSYTVQQVVSNKRGFHVVFLVPDKPCPKEFSPIVCCRGTIPPDTKNLVDDLMTNSIGEWSYESSRGEVRSAFQKVAEEFGPAVITGHSLGGAIAQLITADFCSEPKISGQHFIKEVYHFNAPGVGTEMASSYKEQLKKLDQEYHPKVFAYRHHDDVVSLSGGSHLKATEKIVLGEKNLSWKEVINPNVKSAGKAHSLRKRVSQYEHFDSKGAKPAGLKNWHRFAEKGRKMLGTLFSKAVGNKVMVRDDSITKITKFVDK